MSKFLGRVGRKGSWAVHGHQVLMQKSFFLPSTDGFKAAGAALLSFGRYFDGFGDVARRGLLEGVIVFVRAQGFDTRAVFGVDV